MRITILIILAIALGVITAAIIIAENNTQEVSCGLEPVLVCDSLVFTNDTPSSLDVVNADGKNLGITYNPQGSK